MKQSWAVGIVMAYIILQGITMIGWQSTAPNSSLFSYITGNLVPILETILGGSALTAGSVLQMAASSGLTLIAGTIGMALLWSPLWQGSYLWFWLCVCLPIAVGFWIAVFGVIRGVHSS